MAAIKASELKFGVPVKVSVGAYFLTATTVELPTGKEYENVLEIDPAKLGFTVPVVGGAEPGYTGSAGETATTTQLPAFVWCTNVLEAKTRNEAAKEVAEGYLADVSVVAGKVVLRVFGVPTAGDGSPIVETKKATKKTFTAAQVVTIFALGK